MQNLKKTIKTRT